MTSGNQQVWLITGISRGLGFELARAVLHQGHRVIGTTRNGAVPETLTHSLLHVLPLELTDHSQIERTVQAAHSLLGRLDVVVNNAGYGLLGAVEEASLEEARDVMEADFFGPLTVIQSALPFLRRQGFGHIVNISSIAGLAPAAGSGLYAAAKFALEGMSQSLRQELAPLGIKVTLVEPGAFRTDFLTKGSIRRTAKVLCAYECTSGQVIRHLESMNGHQAGDPAVAAQVILQTVASCDPPLHLLLGTDALRRARTKIDQLTFDLERWAPLAASTDFPEEEPPAPSATAGRAHAVPPLGQMWAR